MKAPITPPAIAPVLWLLAEILAIVGESGLEDAEGADEGGGVNDGEGVDKGDNEVINEDEERDCIIDDWLLIAEFAGGKELSLEPRNDETNTGNPSEVADDELNTDRLEDMVESAGGSAPAVVVVGTGLVNEESELPDVLSDRLVGVESSGEALGVASIALVIVGVCGIGFGCGWFW